MAANLKIWIVMDTAAQRIVQSFAKPGERLIWYGQPTRAAAAAANYLQSLIGLAFLAISGLLIIVPDGTSPETPTGLILLGLPFLAVGLWMATRTLRDYLMAEYTFYGVTDQRILIGRTWPTSTVTSYGPEDIDDITTTENADGSGDVQFKKYYFGAVRNSNAIPERIGFWGVQDAHGVSQYIIPLKKQAAPRLPFSR
jgi:hypothetical protein